MMLHRHYEPTKTQDYAEREMAAPDQAENQPDEQKADNGTPVVRRVRKRKTEE